MKVKTVFRKHPDGEIIALFPEEKWNDEFITCYAHIGQHGGADYAWVVSTTKQATKAEYKALKSELENIGYELEVISASDYAYSKILCKVNAKYGAPMGRNNRYPDPGDLRKYDRRVYLDSGGYDKGGAYWGIGAPLRVEFTADLSFVRFYRD